MTRLAAVLFCVAAISRPVCSQGEAKGKVGGVVKSAQTGELLKGAVITLRALAREKEAPAVTVTSGFDGRFLVEGLPDGNYEVTAKKSGYHTMRPRSLRAAVENGKEVTDLEFKLWRPAALEGEVRNQDGDPVGGARVEALRKVVRQGRHSWVLAATTTTDDAGYYRLFDLRPGEYAVGVSVRDPEAPGGVLVYEYGEVYYPNAADAGEALAVRLNWGDEAKQIDFRLAPAAEAGIAGTACPKCLITFGRAGGGPSGSRMMQARPDGRFGIAGLTPGLYRVTAQAAGMPPQRGSAEVQVAAGRITEVSIALSAGVVIAGSVMREAEPKKEEAERPMSVRLTSVEDGAGGLVVPAAVGAGGQFRLEGVQPGLYRIEVEPLPEGAYLKSAALGGQELTEPVIAVQGGMSPGLVTLRLGFDGGAVRGSVAGGGSGVAVLWPREEQRGYLVERFAEFKGDGTFSFEGVAPGSYWVFALPSRDAVDLSDPGALKAIEGYGTAARVKSKEAVAVEARLVPDAN